jgi:lipopolysaccharide heptosyltransferase II
LVVVCRVWNSQERGSDSFAIDLEHLQLETASPSILIIRLSSLGDIVLTFPLVLALREKYPSAQIDFVVKKEYREVLEFCPGISNVFALDTAVGRSGLDALRNTFRKNPYSHVLDLHNNFRSRILRRGVGEHLSIINKRTLQRWLLVKFKLNLLKNAPDVVGRYFETANALGVVDSGNAPNISIGSSRDPKLVAVAPGARHWNKRWPKENFIEVARKLLADGYKIELYGSADERTLAEEISIALASDRVTNLAGELSIKESTEHLSHASLAITNDSGLMHIANALDMPTISIFGPTIREFGFMPRGENAIVVQNDGLSCRPCTAIGREDCPKGHFRCMKEITTEIVLHDIKRTS